ncbi:hypothetical protein [Marivirga sp.]|uniref:hypothetical protein n=1 Tax=Marivirga sp. TaxID=2018662 RepID=UPI003DA6D93A
MRLLIIGILSSLLSCISQTDESFYEAYEFVNRSNYKIVIQSYTKIDEEYSLTDYSIFQNDTLTQEFELMFGSKTGIIAYSDSLRIIYRGERASGFLPEDPSTFNILNKENYSREEISKNYTNYQYEFSEDDFENAEPIE